MVIKVIFISIILVLIAFAGMSINLLIKKNGKFTPKSIGKSKELRDKGIYCVKTQQKLVDNQNNRCNIDDSYCKNCPVT